MLAGSSDANEVDEPANAELASADAAQKRTQDVVRRLAAFLTQERSEVLTFPVSYTHLTLPTKA